MTQSPRLAKPQDVPTLGITPATAETREARAVEILGQLRTHLRSLSVMLENCTRCGNCRSACHSYLGTEDFQNIPVARAGLLREFYRRHFTLGGRLLRRFGGDGGLDDATIERWLTYFYQCNECRRCAEFCPFGIDTAEITIAARHLLSELGIVPKFMQGVAANLQKTGNNMGIPQPALLDSVEFLEEEMKEETGREIKIPVDQPDSEILYIPSSADFFTNVDTMIGAAKVFHLLGVRWTISSTVLEAANFGLLFDYPAMHEHHVRMKNAAHAVGASLVLQGECGHGWRAANLYTAGSVGPVPFRLRHVLQYTAENLAKLPLRKLPLRVTLHDPCNYARGGGLIEPPRQILRAVAQELVELESNREETFCCGGGSGILMDEMLDVRLKLGRKKAQQVAAVGAFDYLAIPCSICKAQLPPVLKHYEVNCPEMGGIMDLVGRAIVW